MFIDPISITLKSGKKAVIQTADESLAEAFIAFLKTTTAQTEYLATSTEEVSDDVEAEKNYLSSSLKSDRGIQLAVTVDGKLIGSAGLGAVSGKIKLRHRAAFGISVVKEFWGEGVGTALLKEIVNCAHEVGYEQIELQVASTNERAKRLYEKFGFVKTGTLPNAKKLADGSYQSYDFMVLDLRA